MPSGQLRHVSAQNNTFVLSSAVDFIFQHKYDLSLIPDFKKVDAEKPAGSATGVCVSPEKGAWPFLLLSDEMFHFLSAEVNVRSTRKVRLNFFLVWTKANILDQLKKRRRCESEMLLNCSSISGRVWQTSSFLRVCFHSSLPSTSTWASSWLSSWSSRQFASSC